MNPDELIKIRIHLSCSHSINADYEETVYGPTAAEWAEMSEEERDALLDEYAGVTLQNQVDVSAEVLDGD
jgi:hypothetical protein